MPFDIIRHDITEMKVDAIVNAANPGLQIGGGVCGAIFRAAGVQELQKACDKIGGCHVGEAVITGGYNLKAKYIIHTPGPVWRGGQHQEAARLQASYQNSLELAMKHRCESIAFPLIATGIYGYPKEEALQIAVSTISSFLFQHDIQVFLVVFDKQAFALSQKLTSSIQQYIDEQYVDEMENTSLRRPREEHFLFEEQQQSLDVYQETVNFDELLNQLDESFSERLFRFIDAKGLTDVETYKRANIDRRLFSKIRNGIDYTPKKKTAVAFAISLQLNLEETLDLLETAGYTLSRSSKFDVIVDYFIRHGKYNIHEINEVLFAFDQPLLGA
ncbi:macro domain-containing protein [Bacillus rubiinfantis]|uniref:macro domain-containing protein n=1 Tax=Bacillus rubiinfantis TaxID=1499680 RepID=UPI0005A6FC76|nr:macro domain-containing protein [Bacillus rubiinfantis]